jgi:hypothetical protein
MIQQQQAYHMMKPLGAQAPYHSMQHLAHETISALSPSSQSLQQPQHLHAQQLQAHQNQQQQQQQRLVRNDGLPQSMIVNPNTMSAPLNPSNQRLTSANGGNMANYPPVGIMLSEAATGMPTLPPPPINSTTIPTSYPLGYNNKPTVVQPILPPPPPTPPAAANPPHQSFIPDWLTSQGKFCFSDKQISSGKDLTGMKKKYKLVMCTYCAEFLPDTPWATMRPRKYETAVFLEHDRSTHHKKACEARAAKLQSMKMATGNMGASSSSSRLQQSNLGNGGMGMGKNRMGSNQSITKTPHSNSSSNHSSSRNLSTATTTATNNLTNKHSNINNNSNTHSSSSTHLMNNKHPTGTNGTSNHANTSSSSTATHTANTNNNNNKQNTNNLFNQYEFADAYLNPANASVLPLLSNSASATTKSTSSSSKHRNMNHNNTPHLLATVLNPTSSSQQHLSQQHLHSNHTQAPNLHHTKNMNTSSYPTHASSNTNPSTNSNAIQSLQDLDPNNESNQGIFDIYESLTHMMQRNDVNHLSNMQSVVNAIFVDSSGVMHHGHGGGNAGNNPYYPASQEAMINLNHHPMYSNYSSQQQHAQQQQQQLHHAMHDASDGNYHLGILNTGIPMSNMAVRNGSNNSSNHTASNTSSSLQQQQQQQQQNDPYDEQMMINTALLQLIQSGNVNYGLDLGSMNNAYGSANNMIGIMGGSSSRQGSMKSGTLTEAPFSFSDIAALGDNGDSLHGNNE